MTTAKDTAAPAAAPKDDALANQQAGALARPSFIEQSDAGTEGITRDDLKLPRLAIAQGLSPQMIPGKSEYLPELKMFDLFNDISGTIYAHVTTGDETKDKANRLLFVIGRRDVRRIEFEPTKEKGAKRGVPIDMDVPADDSKNPDGDRNKWSKDPTTGKGVPPRATKFVEFVIMLLNPDMTPREPIVLSIAETNKFAKRAAERLTGFIKMRQPPAPIYAGLYTVESGSETNDQGTFGVYVPRSLGFIQDAKLYQMAKNFHLSLQGKTIVVDREPGDETGFDPEAMGGDAGNM